MFTLSIQTKSVARRKDEMPGKSTTVWECNFFSWGGLIEPLFTKDCFIIYLQLSIEASLSVELIKTIFFYQTT